jgi:hypothetical protein
VRLARPLQDTSNVEQDEYAKLRARLAQLRVEHRDLDGVIAEMTGSVYADQLQIHRLKLRKLRVKDAIARIQSELIPDLGA